MLCLLYLNRVPTKVVKHVTPEEKWNQIKPNISNFKVFGCECWAHIPDEKMEKVRTQVSQVYIHWLL